jgi:hypothetical protein
MSWYLRIGGGAPVLFSAIGASKLKRTVSSQKESVFAFSVDGASADWNPLAAEGTICTVYADATPYFAGRLYRIPRKGRGSTESFRDDSRHWSLNSKQLQVTRPAESIDYEIRDPWLDLKQFVFQQQWNVITGTDESGHPTKTAEYRSECILGMDLSGNPLSNGEQITMIIEWAASCGAYCQPGDIAVSSPIPFDEITDMSCAECIKRMLRWSPDAVAWFDYSVTPPAFNVTPRADCEAVFLEFSGGPESVEIHALPFLVPPSVVIRYIQITASNAGSAQVQVIPDVFPGGATGREYGAMVMTCRLAEGQSTYQKQKIKAQIFPIANSGTGEGPDGGNITDGGPSNDPLIQWWQRKVTWLKNFGISSTSSTPAPTAADIGNQLIITNMWGTFDVGEGDDDGTGTVALITFDDDGNETLNTDYANELLQGQIASWMTQNQAKTTWTALVSYSYPSDAGSYTAQDNDAIAIFGGPVAAPDGSSNSVPIKVTARATATNATTSTYSSLTGYTAPESPPNGLAEYLYESLAQLHYEGQYTTVGQEVSIWRLGLVLNLYGGREEWGSMNALLQEITDDLDAGKTTLKFGPPGHLTLQDLMELIRANRTRVVSSHIKERTDGTSGDCSEVDGALQGSSDGSDHPPSAPGIVDFQGCDSSTADDGPQVGIYGGTVSDLTPGGTVWTPTGLVLGQYTVFEVSAGDTVAYLIITYDISTGPPPTLNITSITVQTDDSVPANTSGTLYVQLFNFTVTAASGSTPASVQITGDFIGDQQFFAWQRWFYLGQFEAISGSAVTVLGD